MEREKNEILYIKRLAQHLALGRGSKSSLQGNTVLFAENHEVFIIQTKEIFAANSVTMSFQI